METQKPKLPKLVNLRSVPGGELVSCAEFPDEVLFVPSRDALMMDIFDGEDDQVYLFSIENGEPRQVSVDTTVIWHSGSKVTVVTDGVPVTPKQITEDKQAKAYKYGLRDASQLDVLMDILRIDGKIKAIKYHREASNTGLREAKQCVDKIEDDIKRGVF